MDQGSDSSHSERQPHWKLRRHGSCFVVVGAIFAPDIAAYGTLRGVCCFGAGIGPLVVASAELLSASSPRGGWSGGSNRKADVVVFTDLRIDLQHCDRGLRTEMVGLRPFADYIVCRLYDWMA